MLEIRLKAIGAWPSPKVYEPAAGHLAIVNEIITNWPAADVQYSDISEDGGEIDFLTEPPEPVFDLIITNPPYSFAQEFIERAKLWRKSTNSLIVMLLRINFLGSQKRAKWLRDNVPSLAVSPRRPSMGLNKKGKKGTDATEYAWFIWPQDHPYLLILETEDT